MVPEYKRQLHIVHTDARRSGWCGESTRILNATREMLRRGHRMIVAAPGEGELIKRMDALGYETWPHLSLPRRFHLPTFWRVTRAFAAMLRDKRIDVVHTHGSLDTWVGAFAARLVRPRPLVVRTRHNTIPIKPHMFNRWLYRKGVDRVIGVTDSVARVIEESGIMPADQVAVIGSAVDLERFDPDSAAQDLREALGIPADAPVIGCVARLSTSKGHEDFVVAAQRIAQRYPQAHFVIAGEGKLKERLAEMAAEGGLAEQLHLLGLVEDIPRVLAAMDCFLLCSSFAEGIPASILEALGMGVPVVATAMGSTPQVVREGETGLLIPPRDPETAAAAVCRILADPALAERMGRQGRALIQAERSAPALALRNEQLYFDTLAQLGRG